MSTPILITKLYIPPPHAKAVQRPRLIEQLNEGLRQTPGSGRTLTLISAAAGSGKTTLVSEWVAGCGQPVAWLSLDEGDNDLTRFLTYLIAALRTLVLKKADGTAIRLDESILRVIESPQPPPTEAILTALLNEIATVQDPFVLVLDDYHVIDTKPIDDALAFLIDRLPAQVHLVIATREDPPLPLARLRVRGQLTELRAADLRFTPDEATRFLNQTMGLDLRLADIAALDARTEGWIAGLQLAAISMRGRADPSQFVRAFVGNNRYIVDYLVEEVLQRQPDHVRSFLLQTSILDQLSGPLCDAVTGLTGENDSTALLDTLERGNLFLVPLDDQRHWFRYHHLFAEMLAAHARKAQSVQIPILHQRASAWYAGQGLLADAIRHALAAQDFARAADLVERAMPAMRQSRQDMTMFGWLTAIPDSVLRTRPVLSALYAGVLLLIGQVEGVEARLRDVERWLGSPLDSTPDSFPDPVATEPAERMVVVDEAEFRGLDGSIAIYRAALALARGDLTGTVNYAQRALDLVPEDDHLRRGSAAGFLGLVNWTRGDLDAAYDAYAECMTRLQRAGYISDAVGCTIALADLRLAQGRLREAQHIYARGLQLATASATAQTTAPATAQGEPMLRGAADMHVGLSALCCERNDLEAAAQHLQTSKALGEWTGLRQNPYRWCVAMARLREVQGDLDSALSLLDEAERLYISDYFPNVRPIGALKARVWVAQGQFGRALDWTRAKGLSAPNDLGYLREFEHVTLVRIWMAQARHTHDTGAALDEAVALLARLLQAAEAGGRTRSVIEMLILQAMVHQMHGDTPLALSSLGRALVLAEPEGFVRLFVDEGPPMAALLEAFITASSSRHQSPSDYVQQLLFVLRAAERAVGGKVEDQTHIKPPLAEVLDELVEPLTTRELDVLRLLETYLSGPDIAEKLVVSLNTVRTHIRNIYTKLGVNDRQAAVRRAKALGLL